MIRAANITVVIATRNRPASLVRCLNALLEGEVQPSEIIIVDQSDDDETQAVVKQGIQSGKPILYVRQERRGLSAARNAGIAKASYPWIAITDDDCVPDHNWIAVIQGTFCLPDAPDAITGRVLPLGLDAPGLYAVSSRRSTVRAEFSGKIDPWLVGTGGNFAITRQWLKWVGLYDERLGAGSSGGGGEDMDFFYRLTSAGARILYEPASLIYHERQSKARRIASRSSYGRGIGVFCAIWLRRRDTYALQILYRWLFNHSLAMAIALRHRRWISVYEEFLMVQGTIRGLFQGLCL
jgi:glycosyltransferase involved in cell wall biosynthesis